ncbi:hypothetical protein PAPYR_1710 [Paratrimastix pyriformis]|uniref:Glycosyltransferase family 8 protein n=1 Tax=Paratrimastix pyriformis TaxID=342808 RepID=A0ABQ8UR37_9EUKA|nr:hypothetical protein PAPYR_1710 [Paratrimastix pyriformis]
MPILFSVKHDIPVPQSSMAVVTLITHPFYVPGAGVLGSSVLAAFGNETKPPPLIALVSDTIPDWALLWLRRVGWDVRTIPVFSLPPDFPFERDERRVREAFSKINLWSMTEYSRLLYLDADILVKPTAHLADLFWKVDCRRVVLAASPVRSGYLNSGVMTLCPNATVFSELLEGFKENQFKPYDDQGLLNAYFAAPTRLRAHPIEWLGPEWNARQHWDDWVRRGWLVHYVAPSAKPWSRLPEERTTTPLSPAHQMWWDAWEALCARLGQDGRCAEVLSLRNSPP